MKIFKWFFLGLYTVITIIPKYFISGLIYIFTPHKKRNIKEKRLIPIILLSLSLSVYFICIFLSSKWYVQNLKIKYLTNDIMANTNVLEKETKEIINKDNYISSSDLYPNISYITVDFKELLEKNNETVGWIKVNNTNVNYSIVQHDDNEYYLNHDFNKKKNYYGWVYADFRANFEYFGNNTIIYAHNMTDRSMFGSLVWTLNDSWYTNDENHFIKISTPKSNTVWKIFSIYTVNPETYYLKNYFSTTAEHQQFLDTLKRRSIYDFKETVIAKDKILTLSTCTDDGTKRIVIHAKMVKVEYR